MTGPDYSIGELANLGGVSRRTVRYYVQEGLLPPPLGLGRGARYDATHLERLLQIKDLQERGRTLEEVRAALDKRGGPPADTSVDRVPRTHWVRLEILPGLEMHVSSQHQIPTPAKLGELSAWCRRHFRLKGEEDDA